MARLDNRPLVSVITVCLNAVNTLERTIQSVISQTYPDVEYIIVDGGSTDGTIDIIRKHESRISRWISEKDKGISDAFNKGLSLSKGDWIAFLNAGDAYHDTDSLQRLKFASNGHDIVFGGLRHIKVNKPPSYYDPMEVDGDIYWLRRSIPHQSSIVSRKVFEDIGAFDVNLKYAMDYEHFLRAYRKGYRFFPIMDIITDVRVGGISSVFWKEQLREFKISQERHGVLPFLRTFYYWKRYLMQLYHNKLDSR